MSSYRQTVSSGSTLRWSVIISKGRAIVEFPGRRDYYTLGVKLLNLSGGMSGTKIVHLVVNPSPMIPMHISQNARSMTTVYPVRSFTVHQRAVTVDCSDTMEYHHGVDLNSTNTVEVTCVGEDGVLLQETSGVCIFDLIS